MKAGCDTIKPKCMASGLFSGLSQYLSMYFMPYLVPVQQAEQYCEGWLTAQRAHGNSCHSDHHSDRRSIPIHECTRLSLRASVNWKERRAERHQRTAADPEVA